MLGWMKCFTDLRWIQGLLQTCNKSKLASHVWVVCSAATCDIFTAPLITIQGKCRL